MNLKKVLKEQVKRISFSPEEEKSLRVAAKEIVLKLKKSNLKSAIGGSLAKSTLIRKGIEQDIDVFVVFKTEKDMAKLENALKKAGLTEYKKVHGSRDYFRIKKGGIAFEIIPVLSIRNPKEAKNVTDFSLMHVDYIKKKIDRNNKLADEIKLAKSFCYAQDCYGAESYISGFSGYSLEVLVSYFGSFANFLKKIEKERIIDSERQFKNKSMIKTELNESKLNSPIVLIDPTYKYRNITAGLSEESFQRFLKSAKKFLKNPSLDFFEKKGINVKDLEKKAEKNRARLAELLFSTNKQEGDIAATKMKKFFNFMIKEFERKNQKIVDSVFEYSEPENKAIGFLIIKENKEIEIRGPSVSLKEAVKNFKRARKKVFVKRGFVFAKEKISSKEIFYRLKNFEEEMNVGFEFRFID